MTETKHYVQMKMINKTYISTAHFGKLSEIIERCVKQETKQKFNDYIEAMVISNTSVISSEISLLNRR